MGTASSWFAPWVDSTVAGSRTGGNTPDNYNAPSADSGANTGAAPPSVNTSSALSGQGTGGNSPFTGGRVGIPNNTVTDNFPPTTTTPPRSG